MDQRNRNESSLQIVMKGVIQALTLDGQNRTEEAYVQYLSCIQSIGQTLSQDATQKGFQGIRHADTQKMFKLMDQCTDRIKSLAEKIANDDTSGPCPTEYPDSLPPPYTPLPPMVTMPTVSQQPQLYPAVPSTATGTYTYASNQPMTHSSSIPSHFYRSGARTASLGGQLPSSTTTRPSATTDDLISRLPSVPGKELSSNPPSVSSSVGSTSTVMMSYRKTLQSQPSIGQEGAASTASIRKRLQHMGPLEKAYLENQHLITAYQARMNRLYTRSTQDQTTVSLTLQRRLMDNMAIAKARQEALHKKIAERQRRLQEEAAERFSSTDSAPTADEIERRQIYASVMEYEHNNLWLLQWREKLQSSPQDTKLIDELITQILSSKEHPITQLLQKYQYNIYKKLYTIIEQNKQELDEIKVPYSDVVPLDFHDDDIDGKNDDVENHRNEKLMQETLDEMKSPLDNDLENDNVELLRIFQRINSREFDDSEDHTFAAKDVGLGDENGDVAIAKDVGKDEDDVNSEKSDDVICNDKDNLTVEEVTHAIKDDVEQAVADGDRLARQLSGQQEDDANKSGDDVDDDDDDDEQTRTISDKSKIPDESYPENIQESQIKTDQSSTDNPNEESNSTNVNSDLGAKVIPEDTTLTTDTVGGHTKDHSNDDNTSNNDTNIASSNRPMSSSSEPSCDELIDDFVAVEKTRSDSDYNSVEVMIDKMQEDAFHRHLTDVTKDVHMYLDKLQLMFVVAYEELDSAVGRDQTIASIETPFFQPVWSMVFALFRFVNLKKEQLVATSMTKYMAASPLHVGVRRKMCLMDQLIMGSEDNYPYQPAVTEIQRLVSCQSPLDKLECIVKTSRIICTCVEDYMESQGKPRHSSESAIGCDDLLPILSFVIIKSQLPQLVSECSVMEEFIHEGYLFGEEGYCLTTFQTALTYICKLAEKEPADS
ncbi:VPS9 domain-containing protein 1-like [Glandiceps talaboti]